jgi:5-methylcytosine-specific restriction endonuclease McrA
MKTCLNCGKLLTGRQRKFCSDAALKNGHCGGNYRKREKHYASGSPRPRNSCKRCGVQIKLPRRVYCSDECKILSHNNKRSSGVEYLDSCIVCGGELKGKQQRYCSGHCKRRYGSSKRRGKKQIVNIEVVTINQIHKADKGICQICGKEVDISIPWPKPSSPSIDHIIPINHGGEHSYRNTRLTHLSCNTSRGDKYDGEAMRDGTKEGLCMALSKAVICANTRCRKIFIKKNGMQKYHSRACGLQAEQYSRRKQKKCMECGELLVGTHAKRYCPDCKKYPHLSYKQSKRKERA